MVSGVWVTPRHLRPRECARMQDMGYAGGEDDEMWVSVEGGGVSERKKGGKGGGGVHHHRPKTTHPKPSRIPTTPNAPPKKNFYLELSDESDDGAIPRPKKPKPPPTTTTARPTKAVPAPKPTNPPKTATATPPPPPRPTPPRVPRRRTTIPRIRSVPYPTGVERGTVRGIHGRKYGAVWVEYPGGTPPSTRWPTLHEADRHSEEARGGGKKKAILPAPRNKASNPPNAKPTTEPTDPTNPTNPPSRPAKMWDPTTGSHEV